MGEFSSYLDEDWLGEKIISVLPYFTKNNYLSIGYEKEETIPESL